LANNCAECQQPGQGIKFANSRNRHIHFWIEPLNRQLTVLRRDSDQDFFQRSIRRITKPGTILRPVIADHPAKFRLVGLS
jgi:hypothetical protein